MKPAILGLSGPELTQDERGLLAARPPAGIILFARNIADPPRLASLIASLRELLPAVRLMVDQEGGRVARLRPPHWAVHPPAAAFRDAGQAWRGGARIGLECARAGFDIVTAPVLDVPRPDADPIIGDRAFGTDAATVIERAGAFAGGLLAAGIQPVGKHVPGHGRASVDSHLGLPALDAPDEDDLAPFAVLAARLPWLMTAHILYRDLDPERPATLSPLVIGRVIRGRLAFGGVLVSDDLAMGALCGDPATRARAAIEAGCDLALSCEGDPAGNDAILRALPDLPPRTLDRLDQAADQARRARQNVDAEALA